MKTSSFLVLSATAGVALAYLANASFLADFRADHFVASVAVGGLAAIFTRDYSRRPRPLVPLAAVHPLAANSPASADGAPARSAAYGIRRRRSALVERAA
jgi:hypothetical protein